MNSSLGYYCKINFSQKVTGAFNFTLINSLKILTKQDVLMFATLLYFIPNPGLARKQNHCNGSKLFYVGFSNIGLGIT